MVWSPALNLSQALANIASADKSEKLEALLPWNVKQDLANGIQAPTPGTDLLALTKKVVDMPFDSTKIIESNVIEALADGHPVCQRSENPFW